MLKKAIMPVLDKLLQILEKGRNVLNSFYEFNITLIRKSNKNMGNLQANFSHSHRSKTLKILANGT